MMERAGRCFVAHSVPRDDGSDSTVRFGERILGALCLAAASLCGAEEQAPFAVLLRPCNSRIRASISPAVG
jgi:hypothetical protein